MLKEQKPENIADVEDCSFRGNYVNTLKFLFFLHIFAFLTQKKPRKNLYVATAADPNLCLP